METLKQFFQNNNGLKIFLGIIGTIVLGAISSGVWEYIFKPLLESGTKIIMDIATLGMEAYKNDVYRQIAKGFSEKNSINTYSNIMNIMFYMMILGFFIFYSNLKKIKDKYKQLMCGEQSIQKRNVTIPAIIKKFKRLFYAYSFLVIIFFILNLFSVYRLNYINNSIIYFEQLKKASAPYIPQKQFLMIESRFALINNKDDYVSVMSDLEKILQNENIHIQQILIW